MKKRGQTCLITSKFSITGNGVTVTSDRSALMSLKWPQTEVERCLRNRLKSTVSLAEAREKQQATRKNIATGIDPRVMRKDEKATQSGERGLWVRDALVRKISPSMVGRPCGFLWPRHNQPRRQNLETHSPPMAAPTDPKHVAPLLRMLAGLRKFGKPFLRGCF